jgi:hypothetical protein
MSCSRTQNILQIWDKGQQGGSCGDEKFGTLTRTTTVRGRVAEELERPRGRSRAGGFTPSAMRSEDLKAEKSRARIYARSYEVAQSDKRGRGCEILPGIIVRSV